MRGVSVDAEKGQDQERSTQPVELEGDIFSQLKQIVTTSFLPDKQPEFALPVAFEAKYLSNSHLATMMVAGHDNVTILVKRGYKVDILGQTLHLQDTFDDKKIGLLGGLGAVGHIGAVAGFLLASDSGEWAVSMKDPRGKKYATIRKDGLNSGDHSFSEVQYHILDIGPNTPLKFRVGEEDSGYISDWGSNWSDEESRFKNSESDPEWNYSYDPELDELLEHGDDSVDKKYKQKEEIIYGPNGNSFSFTVRILNPENVKPEEAGRHLEASKTSLVVPK